MLKIREMNLQTVQCKCTPFRILRCEFKIGLSLSRRLSICRGRAESCTIHVMYNYMLLVSVLYMNSTYCTIHTPPKVAVSSNLSMYGYHLSYQYSSCLYRPDCFPGLTMGCSVSSFNYNLNLQVFEEEGEKKLKINKMIFLMYW